MRILVRASNWIGDAVMTLPALAALREAFPAARIDILAIPWVAAVHQSSPSVDRVIVYDREKSLRPWPRRWSFLRSLKSERYDLGILLPNSFTSALELKLCGCRQLLGVRGDGRDLLLDIPLQRRRDPRRGHQIFDYFHLLTPLGIRGGDPQPRIHLTREERDDGLRMLTDFALPRPWIALAPGAAYGSAKMWGHDKFSDLAQALADGGCGVIAVGGPAEVDAAEQIIQKLGEKGRSVAGQLPLRQFFSLLAHCDGFVCNDSGPMHVAAGLQIPTVAVFGSTSPRATGPWNRRARIVRQHLPCAPCLERVCPLNHRNCMEQVTPAMVREKLTLVMDPDTWIGHHEEQNAIS